MGSVKIEYAQCYSEGSASNKVLQLPSNTPLRSVLQSTLELKGDGGIII